MYSGNLIKLMNTNGVTGSLLNKYRLLIGAEDYEGVSMYLDDMADDTWYIINDWVKNCNHGDETSWVKVMEEELSDGDTEIRSFIYNVSYSLNNAVNKFQNIWRTKRAVGVCM